MYFLFLSFMHIRIDPHSSRLVCAKAPSLTTISRSRCCNCTSVFTLNESNSGRDRMWPNLTQHLSEQQGHLISACASSIRMTYANSLVYIHKTSTHQWLLVISLAWTWLCIFKLFAPGALKDWKSYRHVPPLILSYLEYIRKKKEGMVYWRFTFSHLITLTCSFLDPGRDRQYKE